jgi:redox-sensitive bicupin YhaK (pirin superfamily)
MLVFDSGAPVELRAEGRSRLVLIGGPPIDGERHIFWNLVASSPQEIEAAKARWQNGDFPKVPGDEL